MEAAPAAAAAAACPRSASALLNGAAAADAAPAWRNARRRPWSKEFCDFSMYAVFLTALCVSSLRSPRAAQPYYMRRNLEDVFIRAEMEPNVPYAAIATQAQISEWLETIVLPNLYPAAEWSGKPLDDDNRLLSDGVSYRVGRARLRVLRVESQKHCSNFRNLLKVDLPYSCFGPYTCKTQASGDFANPNASKLFFQGGNASTPLIEYRGADATKELKYRSASTGLTYCGGGQVLDLPANRAAAVNATRALVESAWISGGRDVRALIVSFAVYSPHADVFAVLRCAIEMPPGGAMLPTFEVVASDQLAQLRAFRGDGETFTEKGDAALFAAFYLVCFLYALREMRIARSSPDYWDSFWNWAEVANLGLFLLVAFIRSCALLWLQLTAAATLLDHEDFPAQLVSTAKIMNLADSLNALNMILTFYKVFKFFRHVSTLNTFTETIGDAVDEFVLLGCIIAVELCFFALAFQVGFGAEADQYKDFQASIATLFTIFLGDSDFGSLIGQDVFLAVLIFVPFVVMNTFVLASMFLAYLNVSFAHVRDKQQRDREIYAQGHDGVAPGPSPFVLDVYYCFDAVTCCLPGGGASRAPATPVAVVAFNAVADVAAFAEEDVAPDVGPRRDAADLFKRLDKLVDRKCQEQSKLYQALQLRAKNRKQHARDLTTTPLDESADGFHHDFSNRQPRALAGYGTGSLETKDGDGSDDAARDGADDEALASVLHSHVSAVTDVEMDGEEKDAAVPVAAIVDALTLERILSGGL
ncbi:Polycystin cation channel-domain-containing protein [Pelagophyceae sp. CCMP2097]|nr:Polycystin cation channel-domain-containing protein [Pelagophyceae sp. CCMP2097]|mmetsp:Transcript_9303/g.32099  ORF Transcript_9303/g.32099 Transcript_9303/m.32099 type:complete len:758 (-) Transcript_9303:28-2301(-)